MDGDGEAEANLHAGGVVAEGDVNEFFEFGVVHDLLELGFDFFAGEAEEGGVEVDVFSSGEVGVESGAEFEEGAESAVDFASAFGGVDGAGDDAEDGGFSRAVASDEGDGFAAADFDIDVAEGPEVFALAAGAGDAMEDFVEQIGFLLVHDIVFADAGEFDHEGRLCVGGVHRRSVKLRL